MDQQKEQKKSGSILNDVQTAQSGLKIGRVLVSQGGRLVAGAVSGGLPLLGFLGLIVLIFVFTFAIVGFAPAGSGGTPSPQPSQPPISPAPTGEVPVPTTTPPPGGGGGNACTKPYEGVIRCSTENLKAYFGNDPTKTLIASLICQAESRSNPYALNPVCPDYSVGLFQINLIAHCSGAYDPSNYSACRLISEGRRNVCQAQFEDASQNIQYAVQISYNGTVWTPTWSTWLHKSGNIPAVRDTLTTCGINY
ncbi:MAG: hypothetical protein Q7S38_01685 [bacterium]|nr:hypothetical protein [bacterium]